MEVDIIDRIGAICIISIVLATAKYAIRALNTLQIKRYPLKKQKISFKDISRDDLVTIDGYGMCRYDGYYRGEGLFLPLAEEEITDYIRLKKSDLCSISKVERKDCLKWERGLMTE